MATKTLSVITPVWNQANHTARFCVQAYQAYQGRKEVEFIIVDNGSTDHTARLLKDYKTRMSNLKVITNGENLGFSVACNQGARKAGGDILLFLNNDILTWSDYVPRLLETVDDFVIAGPELNQHNTGWNKFGSVIVPYIAGWCLALTKTSYNDLGGFDERYTPCDYEDMDLCYNASLSGLDLLMVELPIRHISGGSAMPDRLAITERNRLKFREKWGL